MKLGTPAIIQDSKVTVYKIPTQTKELDGTFEWDSTTMVVVELQAQNKWGLGYTYGNASIAGYARDLIQAKVIGQDCTHVPAIWGNMVHQTRNDGTVGLTAMAISAIDTALWDLKAQCLDISLGGLLGQVRSKIPVYGSGGFTNYSDKQMEEQFTGWRKQGITRFKMKIGRDFERDIQRIEYARKVLGDDVELFVDANGAYDFQTALKMAQTLSEFGITWFEQPIEPSDLDSMRELRARLPAGINLASGEYIYDVSELRDGIEALAQDFIQFDVTRCKGISGYLKCAFAADVNHIPISSHCAPQLHVALGCALANFKHIEFFSDHSRIEALFFKNSPRVIDGHLSPEMSISGHGLKLDHDQAQKYEA